MSYDYQIPVLRFSKLTGKVTLIPEEPFWACAVIAFECFRAGATICAWGGQTFLATEGGIMEKEINIT